VSQAGLHVFDGNGAADHDEEHADDRQSPEPRGSDDPREQRNRNGSDNVKLLFCRQRPSSANLVVEIVGEETDVGPQPAEAPPEQSLESHQRHERIVKRPDAQSAAQQEAPNLDAVGAFQFLPQLSANQKAAEDEEQVDAGPAQLNMGSAATLGSAWNAAP